MTSIPEALTAALRHHRSGELDRAEQIYREVLETEPNQVDALHLLGVIAHQNGENLTAIDYIGRAIESCPNNAGFHSNIGEAYRALRRLDEAVTSYRRALAINPHSAEAHNNLGIALHEQGKFEDAAACCRRALKIKPDYAEAQNNLGKTLEELDNRRQAADSYGRALQIEETSDVLLEDVEAVRQYERIFERSVEQSRSVTPRQPTKTLLHVGCGPAGPEQVHSHFPAKEWKEIRLDVDPNVRPDIVASITDMNAVAPESVDAVWSSHNLEHLYSHEVPSALREFRRVLRPGGFALITLPDIEEVAQHIAEGRLEETLYISPAGPISAIDVVFGHRESIASGNEYMAHKTGFTAASLAEKLRAAGFQEVDVRRRDLALWAKAYR